MSLRPVLLGFSDFFDEVGAAKGALTQQPAAGKPRQALSQQAASATKKGISAAITKGATTRVFPKAKPAAKVSPHRRSLQSAATVALKAKKAVDKLHDKVQKVASQNKAVAIGVARKVPRTASQKAKQQRLALAQGKLVAAAKKAKPLVEKAGKKVLALKASITKATPMVAKLFATPQAVPGRRGVTRPTQALRRVPISRGAAVRAVVGAYDPTTGEWVDDPTAPVPVDDGSYTDGTESTYGPPVCVLPEDVPIPARTSLTKEEAMQQWENAPQDAVIYDGASSGYPSDVLGSWNIFYGQNDPPPSGTKYPDGFTFGQIGSAQPAWVVRDKVGIVKNDLGEGQADNMAIYAEPSANMKKFWEASASLGTTQAVARNSIARGWGPLIGSGKFHGLQYAMTDDVWFWQADKVPSWYPPIVQADAEVKRLNKEARDAAQAACNADMEAYRLETTARDRDRAQREYDMEMSTQQELTTSAISQSQLQTQQAQMEQQQQAAQYQQEQAASQAELQYAQQMAEFEQQQQQAELAYAQQQAAQEGQVEDLLIQQARQELAAEPVQPEVVEDDLTDASNDDPSQAMAAEEADDEREENPAFRTPRDDDDYEASGVEDDSDDGFTEG